MKNAIKSRKSFEASFAWIFAIIAGSVIILLAIYATVRFVNTGQYAQSSESAKTLLNLLNPVVNGITSAYATKIDFRKETQIYVGCNQSSERSPIFGKQTIGFSEKSAFFNRWPPPSANISRYNKYIFSNDVEQGKTVYIFAKPFYTGFKVDDLVFMNSQSYCFIGAPSNIAEEVKNLELKNVNITETIGKCLEKNVKVCFEQTFSGCNISVFGTCEEEMCENKYEKGYTIKDGRTVQYIGNLIYATIFSSSSIYECNVKRLGMKINQLARVYKTKIGIVNAKGCSSAIETYLENIISLSSNITAQKLELIRDQAKIMDEQNSDSDCMIYAPESY